MRERRKWRGYSTSSRLQEYTDSPWIKDWVSALLLVIVLIAFKARNSVAMLVWGNMIALYYSFVHPLYFLKKIKNDDGEGWRKKRECFFFIFSIWHVSLLHAFYILFISKTTVAFGIYLRIALVAICFLANLYSTSYTYHKYLRELKNEVNERTGRTLSKRDIRALAFRAGVPSVALILYLILNFLVI